MKNRKFLTKILTVLLSTAIVFSGTGMQTMAAASTDGDVTAVDVLATEEVSENSIEKEAEEAKEIPAQTVAEDETGLNLEGATAADYGLEIPTGDGFKTYTVNKGDRVTLSSTATANPGVELVYSWSGNYNSGNSMDFTGYRQSSYTGTFVKNATVTCTATVKNTDISVSQTYYINIDAHFKVNGKKASSFGNGIKLAMGATTVLNPGVLSADSDAMPFTYSWTKCEYTSLNDYTASPTLVEGATASTLTTDPLTTPKCVYQLTVTDKYGNCYWGSFTIQADSGLTGGSDTGDEPVLLTYDQSYTMTSTARVNSGQTLTYKWEYYDGTTTTTLYGENTATLIRNITHSGTYTCTATDVYGYSVQDYFYVAVNAGIGHNDTVHSKQVVTYGNRVNLTSAVEATDGSSVTRQWYKFNNDGDDELISGATTRYYQTPAITKTTSFVCRTFDQYGNYAYESFDCIIDTGLKLANGNTSNETIVYYTPGQTVRLVSTAYINPGKNKTYRWYKWDNGEKDLSVTTSTYTYTYEKPEKLSFGIAGCQEIVCEVSDEYGNSTSETFYVCLNTGIQTGIVFEDKELNCKNEIRLSKEQVSTENRIDYEWYYSDKLEESMEFIEECKNYPDPVDIVADTLNHAKGLPSEVSSYTANKPGYYLQKANDGYNIQIVIYHVTKPAAATHSFGAWTVKTAATTSAAGVETRTCSVCGNSETREIPKLTGSKADAKITIKNGKKKVSKVSVAKGKSVKLTLEVEPKDVKATLVKLDKKSAKIAKVSLKNGKLTIKGKSKGKVTVKIKYGEKTKSFKVTVK